ncbi:hypothetical protein OG453_23095 [Streptomyces sp. NBC_01381]|uniref:hypothetical protein n=1 Tax=Streptomyces sp. NBC_01381 TaxID=2903845 RepID=UPI0022502F7D|nr:hypothetical protein [Streptomyces sp. NBC_01381]MCX4669533.1 hypothetical protein [Streptomyces sp. NBC_01381]
MTNQTRLLPWATLEGNPCVLVGPGTGFMSRMADNIESVQLGMASDLLGHVADTLADPKATREELRFVTARLTESLREIHRIAESRGDRLSSFDHPDVDDSEDGDDDDPQLPAGAFG